MVLSTENDKRAERAFKAAFTNVEEPVDRRAQHQTAAMIVRTITDLMHLCDRSGYDMRSLMSVATNQYLVEQDDPTDPELPAKIEGLNAVSEKCGSIAFVKSRAKRTPVTCRDESPPRKSVRTAKSAAANPFQEEAAFGDEEDLSAFYGG
jgi:hypothetical protein